MISRGGIALLAGLSLSLACFAEDLWLPDAETECRLEGWSKSTDQHGQHVRSSAGAHSEVVGNLPPYVFNFDSYNYGVEFQIIGSHLGWIKIAEAKDDPRRSNLPLRPTYSGVGWIPGESVDFAVQSGSGHLRPDAQSSKAIDLKGDWLTSMGSVNQVVACSGEWVLLDYSLKRQRNQQTLKLQKLTEEERRSSRGRAWFRGVCANQETTCERSWP